MSELLRTLIIDDRPADAKKVVRELERAGFDPKWHRVETEKQYEDQLETAPDVILADYTSPKFNAMRALEVLQKKGLDIPLIIFSGTVGEETANDALKHGAADYLCKDRLERLGRAVNNALEQHRARKETKRAAAELRSTHVQLYQLLAHSPAVIYALKIEGQRVTPVLVSHNIERLLGVTVAESSSFEWWVESLHPEDREFVLKRQQESLSGDGYSMEYRIRHRDGSYHWVEDNNSVVRDENGKAREAVGVWTDITERKQAEAALQHQEKQYRILFETHPNPTWVYDEQTLAFLAVNDAAIEHYGYSREEFLKMSIRDIRPPEDVPALIEESKSRAAPPASEQSRFGGTWRHCKKNGQVICADVYTTRIEFGGRAAHLAIAIDVTEKKKAEDAIRGSEERMRAILESALDCIITMDRDGRVVEFNPAAEKTFGYRREAAMGKVLADLIIPPSARENHERGLAHYLATGAGPILGKRIELTGMRSDGSEFPVELALTRIGSQEPPMFTGFIRDITTRKQAQERLLEQADIINRAHDAVIILNLKDQHITFWNSGAERLYGWNANDAVGRSLGELTFTEVADFEIPLKTLISAGEFHGEIKQLARDGREIIVDCRATLVRNPDGTPRSGLLINTDVTEQKKLETHLLRAQRLESIGTLASGVAHDLNNILAPILMCAEVLQSNPTSQDLPALVSLIEESAKRGTSVVKQVLTFARGIEGERVVIKPAHLIQEMVDIAQKTFPKSIEIVGRYTDNLYSINCDPTQLHQVLLNLSVNARDAMPNGGLLTISAVNFDVDEHYASMTPGATPGPHVMFGVTDTGAGMSRATIDKIFDPFFTTKEVGKGTGLGLSTALGIIKSHGGLISVYSHMESGTTFKILLPAERSAGTVLQSELSFDSLTGNNELLLVVDDEPGILHVTQIILKKHNYRVVCAKDGPEALAIVAQEKHTISAVLTDLSMPYMDGMSLIRTIKQMKPEMRFIASTGQEDTRVAGLHAMGVSHFLAKPYDTQTLLTTVRETLTGKPST